MLRDLPPDEMFEAVAHIGRIKHEFLFKQKRPLAFESNPRKLADALLEEGKISTNEPDQRDLEDLSNLMELSELWFDYKTDKEGKVTWTNKIDWKKEAEARENDQEDERDSH